MHELIPNHVQSRQNTAVLQSRTGARQLSMAARTALRRALQQQLRQQPRLTRPFSTTPPSLAPNPNPSSSPSSSATPEYAIPDPSRPTHFGYETVTESEKRERVAGVFTSVAESYDRMNDLMSFGWHRIWKCVNTNVTSCMPSR